MMKSLTTLALVAVAVVSLAKLGLADDAVETVELFNGKDMTGWDYVLRGDQKMEEVWSVEEGVLNCKGKPAGYIRTKKDFENYKLELEWRWSEGRGGNNGVLVHVSKPGRLGVWPQSLEVQLAHQNAGDFWDIGTTHDVENEEARRKGRRVVNLTDDSEKAIGEWNKMEVICQGDEVKVYVNGDLVNHATNVSDTKGAIALQSEGTPIQYRNIKLTKLK